MKRNKSMPQVLLCVLLCVALVIPFMKATVFAEDSVGTDGTMTENMENGAMPENAGIEENENELLPGSGELFYEDAATAAMDTSMDGDALSEESESDATEESNKEGVFQDGENPAEDGNGTSGDGVFPEGDDSEQVEKGDSADNDFLPEDGNGDSADNDFLSEDGNGDSSEDASRPEMQYPGEDNDVPEITETGEEESGANPGEILPGEESAGTDQDPSDDAQVPAGEGASSEMTMLPEESAQDNLEEITAEEPSMAADAQEQSAAVSYDPAAGPCPLARELTYNGQAQELIDVKDIPEGMLCYSLDGESFSPEIPAGTDAGDYIVYFSAAGEEAAQVFSLTVNIAKADVIFIAPSAAE